jgi:hypothetical protein
MARLCDKYALFRIELREKRASLEYSEVSYDYFVNCANSDDPVRKYIDCIISNLSANEQQDGKVNKRYLEAKIINLEEENRELEGKNQELEGKNQDLEGILKELNNDRMCEACCQNLISTVIVPCGHALYCEKCVKKMKTTQHFQCPKCRASSEKVITLYMTILPK